MESSKENLYNSAGAERVIEFQHLLQHSTFAPKHFQIVTLIDANHFTR